MYSLHIQIALLIAGCFNARLVSLGFGRHTKTISEHNLSIIGVQTVLVGLFSVLALSVSATSPIARHKGSASKQAHPQLTS